jgi:hypothetical protein
MIDIQRLKEAIMKFGKKERVLKEFVEFLEAEQGKKTKRVISLEDRESARRIKELGNRIKENKPFDPEEDFDNL